MAEARNPRIVAMTLLLFAFSLISLPAHAQYGGGTGELNDPYLIYTPEQMNVIGADPNNWDKHFKLMADIDLAGLGENGFNLIGTDPNHPFRGTFEGNGHAISNFACIAKTGGTTALFGFVADPNAEIRNLTLVAPRIDVLWGETAGALIGEFREGTLFNCHAENVDIQGRWKNVGGLVGVSGVRQSLHTDTKTTIRNCSCSGHVSIGTAGGLVGEDSYGSLYECFAACEVSGTRGVGGLVGDATGTTLINCYSTGSVRGDYIVGGLLGRSVSINVIDCYSGGHVTGTTCVGGFIGEQLAVTKITASFWDASVNDQLKGAGATDPPNDPPATDQPNNSDSIGRTTAQMRDPNMFMAAGWDFVGESDGPSDAWAEPPGGGYPILWWQLPEPPKLPFAGGTGSQDDPYLIATGEQLNSIGHNPRLMTAHFRVTNDIDLSGLHFYLIGDEKRPFEGVFDGGNFAISNFTYAPPEAEYVGLFRMIAANDAEVRNVKLVSPVVGGTNTRSVGSLVGLLGRGTVRNCHVDGGRVSGSVNVGGLVGWNASPYPDEGSIWARLIGCGASTAVVGQSAVGGLVGRNDYSVRIADCQANSDVRGDYYVGGLVGVNDQAVVVNSRSGGTTLGKQDVGGLVGYSRSGTVQRSFSTANVQGDIATGGLVGFNFGTIIDCYAVAGVTGKQKVGGLAGRNGFIGRNSNDPGTLTNSYSASHVSGTYDVGGLIGYNAAGSTTACLWDANVSGLPTRIVGPVAKTTAQMHAASTFVEAGWDFAGETANGTEDIWWILEGQDYPRLSWERSETP